MSAVPISLPDNHTKISKLEQAESALQIYRRRLSDMQTQRAEMEAGLVALFELRGDKAADEERIRILQLDGKIEKARSHVHLQEQVVSAERGRGRAIELAEAKRRSQDHARYLESLGGLYQVALEDMLAIEAKIEDADRQFVSGVSLWSDAAVINGFCMTICKKRELAIHALTGKGTPVAGLGVQDLRDRGVHDLRRQIQEYLGAELA